MTSYSKVSGTWTKIAPYGKLSGTWSKAKEAYVKNSGVWSQWWLDGGVNDRYFNTLDVWNGVDNGQVNFVAHQSDGKAIIVGSFTSYQGVAANRVIRLNTDGSVDTTFVTNIGTGASGSLTQVAIQSDGKIILVGTFATWNGTTVNCIVRLNSDGTRDTAFTTNTGTATGGTSLVTASVVVQSDGKIVVGGTFTSWNGTSGIGRIVRLNSDGTRDTAFTTNVGTGAGPGSVLCLAMQGTNIIAGGSFTAWSGTTVNRIVKLASSGSRDTTFTTNVGTAANNTVTFVGVQSTSELIVVGNFTTWGGSTFNRIVKLSSSGVRDSTFSSNVGSAANNIINHVGVFSDNKLIVSGAFTTWNGTSVGRAVYLSAAGVRDTTFNTNLGTGPDNSILGASINSSNEILFGGSFTFLRTFGSRRLMQLTTAGQLSSTFGPTTGFANYVAGFAPLSNGKMIVVGAFTTYNRTARNGIAVFNSDGTRDTSYDTAFGTGATGGSVECVAVQSDGKIVLGGNFTSWNGATVGNIVRLNSDGTHDTSFTTNIGTGSNNSKIAAIDFQSDGKIILVGDFYFWGSSFTQVNYIVRLNTDGTRDTAFTTNNGTGPDSPVGALKVQSDNKILIGGSLMSFNSVSVGRFARLNSDGSLDTTFVTNTGSGFNSAVTRIALRSDGTIVACGEFTDFNAITTNRLAVINSSGTANTRFTTGANSGIYSLFVDSQNRILIGGTFTTFNGSTANRIARITAANAFDSDFASNDGVGVNGTGPGSLCIVYALSQDADARIYVGGDFSSFNNATRTCIQRIGGE